MAASQRLIQGLAHRKCSANTNSGGQVSAPPPCSLGLASVTLGTPVPLLLEPGATPPHPWVLPVEGTRGPPVAQIQSLCVLRPPGLRLALSQTGAAHPLGHPGLRGSHPWPHWGGGQLQEVPMPLSSLLPLTFIPLLYPHGAHLLWTPLGPRDALPALYLTCLRKSVIIICH